MARVCNSCRYMIKIIFKIIKSENKVASYAIIGFGNIGQALAKAFARNSIKVSAATTPDPESFASAAAAIGRRIIPTTLAEAVHLTLSLKS